MVLKRDNYKLNQKSENRKSFKEETEELIN